MRKEYTRTGPVCGRKLPSLFSDAMRVLAAVEPVALREAPSQRSPDELARQAIDQLRPEEGW